MKKSFFVIGALVFSSLSYSQELETNVINKNAVLKLAFIVGDWNGQGWMMGKDGVKHTFSQSENIRFKIDSTALLIEGRGTDNGKTIHNALALLTYNQTENQYSFYSFLANGREGKFKAELIGEKLHWYPMENMRYIISLNEKKQWYETGEMKRGNEWFQFFEMILDKQ